MTKAKINNMKIVFSTIVQKIINIARSNNVKTDKLTPVP